MMLGIDWFLLILKSSVYQHIEAIVTFLKIKMAKYSVFD